MPEGTAIHVVQQGDTVDSIAAYYGVSVESLIRDNKITYPYDLDLGQALFIVWHCFNKPPAMQV